MTTGSPPDAVLRDGDGEDIGDDLEDIVIVDDEAQRVDAEAAARRSAWRGPPTRRWLVFAALAVVVVVADQATKAWLTGLLAPGAGTVVIPDLLNLVHGRNSGILFGLLPQSAPAFAVVSLGVTVLIVVYHAKAGRGILVTLALGLLLGGAIGNLLDRLNHGYVVDWIDMGIGSTRFWTYNIADASITTAIVGLIAMALIPRLAEWGADG